MNGEVFNIDPDYSVVFGFRSSLSLIGLATGLIGYYLTERKWDNEGSAVLEAPQEVAGDSETGNSYVNMNDPNKVVGQAFHYNGARDLVRVRTEDSASNSKHPEKAAVVNTEQFQSVVAAQYYGAPEAVRAQLAMALPLPKMMLAGLTLWSFSFLLDPEIGGLRFYGNFFNTGCFFLSGSMGPLLAFPIRKAVLDRDVEYMKKLMVALISISILLAIFSICDPEVDAPWYFNFFGVLFILLSPSVFMESRKMGFTWFYEGKPKTNSNIFVHNIGPLFLILGVFLLWIGTNAIAMADLNNSYVPFWTTTARGWFVFIAGMVFIVPGQLAMDLAFDQGSLPVTPGLMGSYVYRLNGDTFSALAWESLSSAARILETPLVATIGWFLFGFSTFMPYGIKEQSIQKYFAMFICFSIPFVKFGFVTPAFWRSDAVAYQKWLYVYYGQMIGLLATIGVAHGVALLLSLLGVGLIVAGERRDMSDERKHGILWLNTTPPKPHPNPQVYGLGLPLYIFGWILLCTAMSVPM